LVIIKEIYSELKTHNYNYKKSIITIGSFDGIHLGHQKIFNKMDLLSKKYSANSKYKDKDYYNKILITFNPHPRFVINQNTLSDSFIISPIKDRLELLSEAFNIDIVLVMSFDYNFSLVTATDFINTVINHFDPIDIVMGSNHQFGHKKEGNINFIKKIELENNFKVHEISPKKNTAIENQVISSTLIRKFISTGNIKNANIMLGRLYSLKGLIVKGEGIGKKINFPTININQIDKDQIIPSRGVYFVYLYIEGKKYAGMCNIGIRPTVTNSKEERVEIHIFSVEINVNFYDKIVNVLFVDYIRDEIKFKNKENLVKQLKRDKDFCLSLSKIGVM